MKIGNIKFKAKRLDGKGWAIGDLLHSYENGAIIVPVEGGGAFSVNPSTVCQFTGLKDCKGNEIWEHDLIHFVGYKPTAEVFWSEEDYAFMAASENEPLYLLPHVLEIGKIERVGNKFDKEVVCEE
nr:MAG TPA: YopX protein [Caudoviricetes sp.]